MKVDQARRLKDLEGVIRIYLADHDRDGTG